MFAVFNHTIDSSIKSLLLHTYSLRKVNSQLNVRYSMMHGFCLHGDNRLK